MADPALVERARDVFVRTFGAAPACFAWAPGRVNLIGEHTDYNDGFVLPCAIDRGTVVAAGPRADGRIVSVAADHGETRDEFSVAGRPERLGAPAWANYVRGVAAVIGESQSLAETSLAIAGDVPQGAGLSSSASLEVAVALALSAQAGLKLPAERLALAGQQAENGFVGISCGIMDQLASGRGEAGHALLIDCRSLAVTPVPIPASLALVVIDSRIRRGLVGSAYNERRRQCEAAARHYGVAALRDLDEDTLLEQRGDLDAVTFARARHVVTENARVLAAAAALADGDVPCLSALMAASHASMRDDFEITIPAIDRLAEIAATAAGNRGGARMTGGGFGGCVVALMESDVAEVVIEAVRRDYLSPDGEPAAIHVFRASAGARLL